MRKLSKIVKNRYVLILSLFLVWMLFFDQDSVLRQLKLSRELDEAKDKREFYSSEIEKDSTLLHQLETDKNAQEKMGREEYRFVGENEELFLIVDEDKEK